MPPIEPGATLEHPDPREERARAAAAHGRATMPAGRVLIVILVAVVAWAFLYAPRLERSSRAQPLGTRRTVSLWVLGPMTAITDVVRLTALTDGLSRALGRDPNAGPGGSLDIPEPEELPTVAPSVSPTPQEPVVEDSKIRRPTRDDELRVAVVGDSLAAGLGVYLEREFRRSLVRVTRQGRISTGLSRLDYFDWLGEMRRIVETFHPDLVVVMLGDNDNQSLQSPDGRTVADIGSIQWPLGYEERVEEFTRTAVDGGAHVAWVGLPIVQRKERWTFMQRQNEIFERVTDATPNALFLDTWEAFATRDGKYTPFRWEDGKAELVRASDGFHFTPRGYELVAQDVADAVIEQFRLSRNALA